MKRTLSIFFFGAALAANTATPDYAAFLPKGFENAVLDKTSWSEYLSIRPGSTQADFFKKPSERLPARADTPKGGLREDFDDGVFHFVFASFGKSNCLNSLWFSGILGGKNTKSLLFVKKRLMIQASRTLCS
jgi:hypothetical protein